MTRRENTGKYPLQTGQEREVLHLVATEAGSKEIEFEVHADTVLCSLDVLSVTGSVKVEVFTETSDGQETRTIEFASITSSTLEPLIQKAAITMEKVIVKATYTGACEFKVRARGTAIGEASFKILGATTFDTDKLTASTTAGILIASALTNRATVAIQNESTTAVVQVSGSLTKVQNDRGWLLKPGASLVIDIQAGQVIYAISTQDNTEVRIAETGA